MTVKECYEEMGADYEGVMKRLLSEERVKKYLLKLISEHGVEKLYEAIEKKEYEEAFRFVHNLKGICLNLGLKQCFQSNDALCEALRNGEPKEDISPLFKAVQQDYEKTKRAVEQL